MKYLLIIILCVSASSENSLRNTHQYFSGRYAFKCFDTTHCISIDSYSINVIYVGETFDQGNNWETNLEFSSGIDPINITTGIITQGYIHNDSSFYFSQNIDRGTLFYTNNGGKSFTKKIIGDYEIADDFIMLDNERGMLASFLRLHYTKDNWETWDTISFDNIIRYKNFTIKNDSILYFTGDIRIKSDGKNFPCLVELNYKTMEHEVKYIFPDENPNSEDKDNTIYKFLHFYSDKIGYYYGSIKRENEIRYADIIYKTTDGGDSWRKVLDNQTGSFQLRDMGFRDSLYGITVEANKYYETFDGGETWQHGRFPMGGTSNHISCQVRFAGKNCIIGSYNKGMYIWEEITSVSLKDIGNLKVWQTGSNLRVGSDINGLYINIFDLQGNIIKTTSFNKNTILNLSDKPSGTYLFNIINQNQIIQTGKLSLVN